MPSFLKRLAEMPAWTESKAEEVIAVLWLIAALEAWRAGIRWLAWACFIKFALDVICTIGTAIAEMKLAGKPRDK